MKALLGAGLVVAATMAPGLSAAAPPVSTARGESLQFKTMLDQSFCIDVDEAGPAVIISQCNPLLSERFTLTNGADGRNLMIDSQGRCLGRGARIDKELTAVTVAPCTYQAKERWSFTPVGQMTQGSTNRCLGISRAAAMISVYLVPCENVNAQLWKLAQ